MHKRWVASVKLEAVKALDADPIEIVAARYEATVEEVEAWRDGYAGRGVTGLKTTKRVRKNPRRGIRKLARKNRKPQLTAEILALIRENPTLWR